MNSFSTPPSLYILVIAHPDDESMFFVPTLCNLFSSLDRVWIVCLSNGNYDGLGRVREKELLNACTILRVEKCLCLNVCEDNPHVEWPATTIASALDKTLKENLSQVSDQPSHITILTFDEGGVSGHPNHIDTYRGVQYWLSNTFRRQQQLHVIAGWKLTTVSNVFFKYIPLFWIPVVLFSFICKTRDPRSWSYSIFQPLLVWKAMACHQSQFVWYRRLSVLFSRYTYYNTWSEIDIEKR